MIRVENIKKTFNPHSSARNQVLKGVSFDLSDKGLVAIFGKSGSGKTTLLNILGGLEKADSGKITVDGEVMSGNVDRIRNRKIGFIFQNYYLERGYTIAEIMRNAMLLAGFKDEKEIERRSEEVLKLVDMERFKNKQGDALSGGQKQRVAIARALIKGADVILADEPTGNLDAQNTYKVMDILKEISKTKLVVLVTHEVTLIKKYADSHIKLVDGQLVDDAEIDEAELASITYGDVKEEPVNAADLSDFNQSTAKKNGKLFTLKNILHSLRADSDKSASGGNIGIYQYVSKSTVSEGESSYVVWDVKFVASAGGYNANEMSCQIDLGDISDEANIVRYEVMEGSYYFFSEETKLYFRSVSKIHANAFTNCENENLSGIRYSSKYMGSAISGRKKLSELVNDENCASVFEEGWYEGYTDEGLGSYRMSAI